MMSFLDDVHQRLNQVNSQVGWPALVDTEQHDKIAQKMADALFARVSPLDSDPEAQALALETYRKHHRLYVESKKLVGETITIEPFGAQRSSLNPCLFVILACDPRALIEVTPDKDHKAIAQHYLSRNYDCDIEVSINCEAKVATEILPIKSGELICLYKACTACVGWFYEDDREQFRKREFIDGFDEEY